MKNILILILACALFFGYQEARAENVIVGVIANHNGTLPESFQDEEIKQLAESHVTTIRTGLASFNIDFIIKAHQRGIGSIVIVGLSRPKELVRYSLVKDYTRGLHPKGQADAR